MTDEQKQRDELVDEVKKKIMSCPCIDCKRQRLKIADLILTKVADAVVEKERVHELAIREADMALDGAIKRIAELEAEIKACRNEHHPL